MSKEVTQEQDPYEIAADILYSRVEILQQAGLMHRPSEITNEEDLDDHFDNLTRLYRQVCAEMDLPWPPPVKEEEETI